MAPLHCDLCAPRETSFVASFVMDTDFLHKDRLTTWEFQRDFYPPPRRVASLDVTKIVARHSPAVFTFKRLARVHPITGKARCLVMVTKLATVRQLPTALLAFNCAMLTNIRPEDVRVIGCELEAKLMGCSCWPRDQARIDLKGFHEWSQQQIGMFRVRPSISHNGCLSLLLNNGVRITMRENGWIRIEHISSSFAVLRIYHWLLEEVNLFLKLTYPVFHVGEYETIV